MTLRCDLDPDVGVPDWVAGRPDAAAEPSAWLLAQWRLEEFDGQVTPDGAAEQPPEPWQLDDAALLTELSACQRALACARGRWLAVLAETERRHVTMRVASTPTATWLAAGTTHSAASARAEVRLAGLLDVHPVVGEALRSGAISVEQSDALAFGLARLPESLQTSEREAVAAHLVGLAAEFNPPALRRLVNHAVAVVAPEVVDDHDRQSLDRADRIQRATRSLGWKSDPEDGGLRFWGKLPALEGELLRQHLSAMASSQRAADALMGVETTQAQALADALALVVGHHAGCEGGPVRGGDHSRVLVTLGLDTLVAGLGAATLIESDGRISAGQVRHLACTAGLVPVVLDGQSVPLDLGRSQRLFSRSQRLALALRDGGCAFPGCDRPPSDSEAHHAGRPWWAGGTTDISQGVLLCPHHHHLVEPDPHRPDEQNWHIDFDGRGRPRFAAPVRPGGVRLYRQHHRFRS